MESGLRPSLLGPLAPVILYSPYLGVSLHFVFIDRSYHVDFLRL